MLIITRRAGEKIVIGDQEVVITVLETSGGSARIGIEAPRSTPVYREEIFTAVKEENAAAAAVAFDALAPPVPTTGGPS